MVEIASAVGSRRPGDWPQGLTISFRPVYENQIQRIYFLVGKGGAGAVSYFFGPGTYQEKRLAALSDLAQSKGYGKIPSTWLEAVADTHEGFLKQCFITHEYGKVSHYYYNNAPGKSIEGRDDL